MPNARFIVTVTSRESDSDEALADAGRYLAYADQTDLFGYHGKIEIADVSPLNKIVTIEFTAPVAQESQIRDFLDECDTLARVENAKCVTNPNL